MRKTTLLLAALALVAGCASSTRMTSAERLEWYRSHAGEPVRSFVFTGRLWGWRSLGDGALTVWTRSDQGFLIELFHRCPEMSFATSIGLTNRASRVSAGFDSVVVVTRSGTQTNRINCRINTIRPLNTRVVQEKKEDLQDVEVLERDPSVPDEPQ